MNHRFAHPHFIGAIPNGEAFCQELLQLLGLNIDQLVYIPNELIPFTAQMHLKGHCILTHNSPRLGQMDFKPRTFGNAVGCGSP